jgi:pSer/pThr/pTyr-binding forkhead associated (FHA) protein
VPPDHGSPKAPRTVRLKLPTGWTVLPVGSYQLGRSHSCHFVLDGAKVSRLHARLDVEADRVWLEDLGSSNGSYVNGQRVTKSRHALSDGDIMVIGDFELTLSIGEKPEEREVPSMRATLVDAEPRVLNELESTSTTRAAALDLLGSVAERAIAVGDATRAENILRAGLQDLLDGARKKENLDAQVRNEAARLALSLARAIPSASWIDYAIELLTCTNALPNEVLSLDLERSVSDVNGADVRKLMRYAEIVQAMPSSIEKVRTLHRFEAMIEVARGKRR